MTPEPPPVEPRDAASLIVVQGERLLMGRRPATARFMPNVLVFPGGAVDAADATAPVAAGVSTTIAAQIGDPTLARALAHAAARELSEEVGLNLGVPPNLAGLAYLCRAITPADRPIRFDARFLVVDAAAVGGSLAGSAELADPGWLTPEQALAEPLALATRAVLGQFAQWRAAPDDWHPPVLRERAWQMA